jgi:hypothetical protein
MQIFNSKTQKVIRRDRDEQIQSIKPIFNSEEDPILQVHEVIKQFKTLSSLLPGVKFQAEINSIPEADFGVIKDDLAWKNSFLDQGSRCFYQPTINSVIILHKAP